MNIEDLYEIEQAILNDDVIGFAMVLNKLGIECSEKMLDNPETRNDIFKQIASKIESNEEVIKYFKTKLSSKFMITFITYFQNKDLIKEFVKNRQKYRFEPNEVARLIKATGDVAYIKECIEKWQEYNFSANAIVSLLQAAKDSEYIKKYIENRHQFGIPSWKISTLLQATEDSEYIKQCIENRQEFGFPRWEIPSLIRATGDSEYIKQCIERNQEFELPSWEIVSLIRATGDSEYIKQCIKKRQEYGLEPDEVALLIGETKDREYIKECIEKRQEYDFAKNNVLDLIEATGDSEYVKECIKNRQKYDFSKKNLLELIELIGDSEYIKKCIEDRQEYHFTKDEVLGLIEATGEPTFIKKYIDEHMEERKKSKDINLPADMTIGIEIEAENGIRTLNDIIDKKWELKGDGSLQQGLEVISPILKGDTHSVDEIYDTCSILKAAGFTTSKRCGGHIHIGADYLKSKEAYQNLSEIWANAEKILFIISNPEGQLPRRGVSEYSSPISKKIEKAIEDGEIDIFEENELREFVSELKKVQGNRYSAINFFNAMEDMKNTIEFRLSNGTIDPDVWVENINLYGGIVKVAQELAIIQGKPIGEITAEDLNKLQLFELLKDNEISQDYQLEVLLNLIMVDEEQKDVYRRRYRVNSKLLEKNPEESEVIESNISSKKVNLSAKKAGKIALAGKDPITGVEYQQVHASIDRMIKNEKDIETR